MRKRLMCFAVVLLFFASISYADVITFTENGFNYSPSASMPLVGDEWQNLGIMVSNVYWYADTRDPFDQRGISPNSGAGRVDFLNTVSQVGFEFVALANNDFHFDAYDSGDNLVAWAFFGAGQYTNSGGATLIGPIDYILFYDTGGQIGLSTLEFSAVPEPGTLILLSCGLLGLGFIRRLRIR